MAEKSIESEIQSAIAAGKLNGAVLIAEDSKGDFSYRKAFGERTLLSGEKKPEQMDDVLFLASATKLLAAIAALQCVEDGLLSLTGDLSGVAPELAAKQVLKGFQEDGETPILEAQVRPITLSMLLTHSSGLVYHFMDPQMARWRDKYGQAGKNDQLAPEERKYLTVDERFDTPLTFQPGSAWAYSPGLDWAGLIVERATGKTLEAFLKERTFGPLGFPDEIAFYPVTDPSLRSRLVDLNPDDPHAVGRPVLGGMAGDHLIWSKGAYGGQNGFTTGPAYAAVLRSLLANDGKILKPATADLLFQQHLSDEAAAHHAELLEGPVGEHYRVGTAKGSKAGYGLGGLISMQDTEGYYGDRTLAWGGGLTFAWFVDRQNDLAGLVALQARLPFDGAAIAALKQTFREDAYRIRRKAGAATQV